ncbi:hypothetical protein FG978_02760 [Escherichia coli]|nr:hypothetical protein [Escherichia coli]
MASVSISCPSCSATDGVVRITCSLLRLGIHFSSCDVKNPYLRVPTQIV